MSTSNFDTLTSFLKTRFHDQAEYLQATSEVLSDIIPIYSANERYKHYDIARRLCLPERIIYFTVTWMNSAGEVEVNQGWRVQHNSVMGPYKGGLRFHPSVSLSVLKFLAFEQTFKNALTGLPMGGGKGGADFNPKARNERDIMLFCQAYMRELQRHIGEQTDVPAGDINVSAREIGYLYGEYRRLNNRFEGVLTGKGLEFGGSHIRTEATGFGLVYFLDAVCTAQNTTVEGKKVTISGAGNVALHAALKCIHMGARVLTLSNSRGFLYCEHGYSENDINWAIEHASQYDNILTALKEHSQHPMNWYSNEKPWGIKGDIALPCATQNELLEEDAQHLLAHGCQMVLEGANMPCDQDAQAVFSQNNITFVPGKAANAGGVALSGLEMAQNAVFSQDDRDVLDNKLRSIMQNIHQRCLEEGQTDSNTNYARGANIAAFKRLAEAMVAQGV